MKGKVLNLFNIVVLSWLLGTSFTANAGKASGLSAEVIANDVFYIESVKGKVITIMGHGFAVNSLTKIYDKYGKRDLSALRKDVEVRIKYNDTQRYINYPVLSEIFIVNE